MILLFNFDEPFFTLVTLIHTKSSIRENQSPGKLVHKKINPRKNNPHKVPF